MGRRIGRQKGRLTGLAPCLLCLLLGAGVQAQAGEDTQGALSGGGEDTRAALAGGGGPGRASFAYREDPGQLVLRYVERPGELGGVEAEQTLSVYGDGRVVAERPRFAKRAGSWGTQLRRDEVQALVGSLLERGIVELDESRLRRSRQELREQRRLQRGELFHVSDADVVTVELHLDRYRGTGPGARERRNVVQRVRWRGLRSDLQRYPELAELRRLGDVHGELRALMDRPDLRRLDARGGP